MNLIWGLEPYQPLTAQPFPFRRNDGEGKFVTRQSGRDCPQENWRTLPQPANSQLCMDLVFIGFWTLKCLRTGNAAQRMFAVVYYRDR